MPMSEFPFSSPLPVIHTMRVQEADCAKLKQKVCFLATIVNPYDWRCVDAMQGQFHKNVMYNDVFITRR